MREIGFILLHLTHLNKLFIFPREEIERAKDEKKRQNDENEF
jgi:penicillin-binding protein-related factor A (putative recombinase)